MSEKIPAKRPFNNDVTEYIPMNSLLKNGTEVEKEFPTRDALIYACRLIGEKRLYTETLHGLETAKDTLLKEIHAREKFETDSFTQKRIERLRTDHKIVWDHHKQLVDYQADPEEINSVRERVDTYYNALYPSHGLTIVEEAIHIATGKDFNDDVDSFLPPEPV